MYYIEKCKLVPFLFIILSGGKADRDVAVIIGGSDNMGKDIMEIYDMNQNTPCDDFHWLPPFPVPQRFAAGAFVESVGIVVCGGVHVISGQEEDRCFTLSKRSSVWKVNSPGAIVSADMVVPYPHGSQNSYWMIPNKFFFTNLTFFKSPANDFWMDGVPLPHKIKDHCSTKVEFGGITQYYVIGGTDHNVENHRTWVYCKEYNAKMCPKGNGKEWVWGRPDLTVDIAYFRQHTCTSFKDQMYGKTIVVAGGIGMDIYALLHVETCVLTGTRCFWIHRDTPPDMSNLIFTKMTNINEQPVLFGGLTFNGTYSSKVWVLELETFMRPNVYVWKPIHHLKSPRGGHVAIAVPRSFVCNNFTTSVPRSTAQLSDGKVLQ